MAWRSDTIFTWLRNPAAACLCLSRHDCGGLRLLRLCLELWRCLLPLVQGLLPDTLDVARLALAGFPRDPVLVLNSSNIPQECFLFPVKKKMVDMIDKNIGTTFSKHSSLDSVKLRYWPFTFSSILAQLLSVAKSTKAYEKWSPMGKGLGVHVPYLRKDFQTI